MLRVSALPSVMTPSVQRVRLTYRGGHPDF